MPALRLGLTGGIGSGKSVVAACLARRGAAIIDTDSIARALTLPGGAAMSAIGAAFGTAMIAPDGALDRDRMRALAFSDESSRIQLGQILHPLIGAESERQAAAATAQVLVFDVPLLAESGRWRSRLDRILVVDCSEAIQLSRVVARSGWSPEMVRAVMARQATRAARRACADAVVHNDGIDLAQLESQLGALWQGWTEGC